MFPINVYDLETCNDYDFKDFRGKTNEYKRKIIALKSHIMEISVLHAKDIKSKPVYAKIKVTFPKLVSDCTEHEIAGLKFYFEHQLDRKINSNLELVTLLKEHNKQSKRIDSAMLYFIKFMKKYNGVDIFDDSNINSFSLIGKNNHGFDDIIINHFLNIFYPHTTFQILERSWDLQKFIFDCKDDKDLHIDTKMKFRFIGKPNYDNYGKFIGDSEAYTLENIYRNIFKREIKKAHDSKFDVYATFKIFMYYYLNFKYLVEEKIQSPQIDLVSHFKELTQEEVKS